jgi:hypothetical protein
MARAWSQVNGLGLVRQQFPGLGVEEHQGLGLDPDRDPAAGEYLPGRDVAPGQLRGGGEGA